MHLYKTTFITIFVSALGLAHQGSRWSEGEHLELGEKGALLACSELGLDKTNCPVSNIARSDKKIKFSYGELVVSADYYKAAQDLYLDTNTGIKKVLKCAHKLYETHPIHDPTEGDYDGCDITGIFSVPGYLEVISQNYNHFGWNNMKAYVQYHENALNKAREAYYKKASHPQESQALFTQALILNAFADHYLTDAFAAGHIRLPRIQIKNWAAKNLNGFFKSSRGDMLAVIFHNSESQDLKTGYEIGLKVKNSRGENWITRSDQYLHIDSNPNDPAFAIPLTAVKESFKELLVAWQTGYIPETLFSATEYVPFHDDVPMAKKFTTQYQGMKKKDLLKSIYSSIPFWQSLFLPRSDAEKLIAAFPSIFKDFRQAIAKDLLQTPQFRKRLPALYLEAHETID